jgi:hypothetical protein
LEFTTSKSVGILLLRCAGSLPVVDLVVNLVQGHRGRAARSARDWHTFHFRLGYNDFTRLAFFPFRQALHFATRRCGLAASYVFRRRHIRGHWPAGNRGGRTLHRNALKAYKILPPLAAAVFGNAAKLLPAPLNPHLGSHSDSRLHPYTGSPGRLVFHARRNRPQSSTLVFPRRLHQDHDRRPRIVHDSSHATPIGKNANQLRTHFFARVQHCWTPCLPAAGRRSEGYQRTERITK